MIFIFALTCFVVEIMNGRKVGEDVHKERSLGGERWFGMDRLHTVSKQTGFPMLLFIE